MRNICKTTVDYRDGEFIKCSDCAKAGFEEEITRLKAELAQARSFPAIREMPTDTMSMLYALIPYGITSVADSSMPMAEQALTALQGQRERIAALESQLSAHMKSYSMLSELNEELSQQLESARQTIQLAIDMISANIGARTVPHPAELKKLEKALSTSPNNK